MIQNNQNQFQKYYFSTQKKKRIHNILKGLWNFFGVFHFFVTECTLQRHKKGVKIRIIVEFADADIIKLSKKGISVKLYKHSDSGHQQNKVWSFFLLFFIFLYFLVVFSLQ